MKYLLVSIYDKAVETYGRPFCVRTPNEAIRIVSQEANRKSDENQLHTHPKDYVLHHVGEWDDETGNLTGLERPERIIEIEALIKL